MATVPLESYGNQLWSITNNLLPTAIPLFVLFGVILLWCSVTDRIYKTLSLWPSPLLE